MTSTQSDRSEFEAKLRWKAAIFPKAKILAAISIGAILIATWQSDFVAAGVAANPYLNLMILSGLVLGIGINYYHLFALKDDFMALDQLYEALEDARHEQAGGSSAKSHATAVWARLRQPAILFNMPGILGSGYKLLSQEIARKGVLAISSGTKKLLVDEIEERIDERTTLTTYVAGLMVLLGLLGTFIGLMETVGSVGAIISGLDLSGGAGIEAIQKLISNLRAPLNGMATGFSSSLFGLIASLIIGIMAKVVGGAAGALKSDFEHWVNQVARIENSEGEREVAAEQAMTTSSPAAAGSAMMAASVSERLMLRVARLTVASNAKMAEQLEALVQATLQQHVAREQDREALSTLREAVTELSRQQIVLLDRVAAADERGAEASQTMTEALVQLRSTVASEAHLGRKAMERSLETVTVTTRDLADIARAHSTVLTNQVRDLNDSVHRVDSLIQSGLMRRRNNDDEVERERRLLLTGIDAALALSKLDQAKDGAAEDDEEDSEVVQTSPVGASMDDWVEETCGAADPTAAPAPAPASDTLPKEASA